MDLGKILKELRQKRGLSQEELAGKINEKTGAQLKRNTISNYENNISNPDLDTLNAMIEILDTTADFIFDINKKASEKNSNSELILNEQAAEYLSIKQNYIFDTMKRVMMIRERVSKSNVDKLSREDLLDCLNELIEINDGVIKRVLELYE